ncbi:hypothetical protein ABZ897_35285 [Nonomuraea sp. NPDC046802]|uniref:hypothetical protein n=1 Tax=Nonomuraea sp. NPDC046802 TaxID=3154919 RepID=UPI0033C82FC1
MTDAQPAYPRFSWRSLSWSRLRDTFDERRRLLVLLRFSLPRTLAGLFLAVAVMVSAGPLTAVFAHDVVGTISSTEFAFTELVWPVAGFAAVMLARQAAEIVTSALKASASRRIDGVVRSRVRRIALRPDRITHLEDPEFHDVAVRAGDQGWTWRVRSPGAAAVGQLEITARTLSAVATAAVLAVYLRSSRRPGQTVGHGADGTHADRAGAGHAGRAQAALALRDAVVCAGLVHRAGAADRAQRPHQRGIA